MERIIARKRYQNGRFGVHSASLSYDDGLRMIGGKEMRCGPACWIVASHDRFAHRSLSAAKTQYRSIGSN